MVCFVRKKNQRQESSSQQRPQGTPPRLPTCSPWWLWTSIVFLPCFSTPGKIRGKQGKTTPLKVYRVFEDPCVVYLPIFGWFFMINVGKYAIHGSYEGLHATRSGWSKHCPTKNLRLFEAVIILRGPQAISIPALLAMITGWDQELYLVHLGTDIGKKWYQGYCDSTPLTKIEKHTSNFK